MSSYQPRSQGGWPDAPPPGGSSWEEPDPRYRDRQYRDDQYGGDRYGGDRYGDDRYYGSRYRERPRRRRRRGWIGLLVTLIVLGAIFVAGDQFARSYAQNMIAQKATSFGFPTKPAVSIKGWPFLTQVAARDIGELDVDAGSTTFGSLNVSSLHAVASQARISSSYNGAEVDTVTGTAVVPFSALLSAMGAKNGMQITADPADGPQSVTITAGQLTTKGSVSLRGTKAIELKISSPNGVPLSALGVPPEYTLGMPSLPFGLTLTGVSATGQGISVQGTARNVTLGQ